MSEDLITKEEKLAGLQNVCDYLESVLDELRFLGNDYEEEYVILDNITNFFEGELAKTSTEVGDRSEDEE